MMMKFLFITLALVAVSAQFQNDRTVSRQLFDETNAFRRENGLAALRWSDDLFNIACPHNIHMYNAGQASHDGFSGRSSAAGRLGFTVVTENAAGNSFAADPPSTLTRQFIRSPAHRANMLSNRVFMGQCFGRNGRFKYTTQLYANRTG